MMVFLCQRHHSGNRACCTCCFYFHTKISCTKQHSQPETLYGLRSEGFHLTVYSSGQQSQEQCTHFGGRKLKLRSPTAFCVPHVPFVYPMCKCMGGQASLCRVVQPCPSAPSGRTAFVYQTVLEPVMITSPSTTVPCSVQLFSFVSINVFLECKQL